ncbi:MAG: putative Ig domain-containing protein, partial [Planctomycetota bacterium]
MAFGRTGRSALALLLLGLAVTAAGCSSGSSGGAAAVGAAPAGLSYDATAVVYLRGVPIAPNEARVADGTANEFTVTPALPVGIDFDPNTGRISGTPGELRPQAVYVVTAKND